MDELGCSVAITPNHGVFKILFPDASKMCSYSNKHELGIKQKEH